MIAKKGRPKGVRNGEGTKSPWSPKKWKPLYDTVVALHVAGFKNVTIARDLQITTAAVGLILNSPEGQAKVMSLNLKKDKILSDKLTEKISAIQNNALKIVDKILSDDALVEAAPLKMFDRALRTLGSTGIVKQEPVVTQASSPASTVNNTLNLVADSNIISQLTAGVTKALEASKLHADAFTELRNGSRSPVKVIDR